MIPIIGIIYCLPTIVLSLISNLLLITCITRKTIFLQQFIHRVWHGSSKFEAVEVYSWDLVILSHFTLLNHRFLHKNALKIV